MVVIKEEYFQKFEANEITIEDFKWDNVEEIRYEEWYDTSTSRWMMVYLKHHGEKEVLNAIEHFRTLDFVKTAEPNYYVCIPETYCKIS